jgi:hypothetical protein
MPDFERDTKNKWMHWDPWRSYDPEPPYYNPDYYPNGIKTANADHMRLINQQDGDWARQCLYDKICGLNTVIKMPPEFLSGTGLAVFVESVNQLKNWLPNGVLRPHDDIFVADNGIEEKSGIIKISFRFRYRNTNFELITNPRKMDVVLTHSFSLSDLTRSAEYEMVEIPLNSTN